MERRGSGVDGRGAARRPPRKTLMAGKWRKRRREVESHKERRERKGGKEEKGTAICRGRKGSGKEAENGGREKGAEREHLEIVFHFSCGQAKRPVEWEPKEKKCGHETTD